MKRMTRIFTLLVAVMMLMTTVALAATEIVSDEFSISIRPVSGESA